jgi:competence protein ComEA
MLKLLRLSGLVLIAFMLLAAFQPRPAESIVVPRAEARPNGVVRSGGSVWIDLNRADEALLTSIPGVGPVLAGRILAWIDKKGALTAPEQLLEVEGIGPAKLRNIQEVAVITP